MFCIKCKAEIPNDALFCHLCGKKQTATSKKATKRANGSGSVYKRSNGTWMAVRVFGYTTDENGFKKPNKVTKSGFKTKKEAVEYLPMMLPSGKQKNKIYGSFAEIFDLWFPFHERKGKSKSTMDGYKAAYKHYWAIHKMQFSEISIDDLQECIDDCPFGRRTKENMKALGTLLYDYAIPRGYVQEKVNLAHYLFVGGGAQTTQREEFTAKEIEIIADNIGKIPYADYIYCNIYLGFRPHEFLSLTVEQYNQAERCFVGGGKTEAGTNRTVTVSPKIQPIIDRLIGDRKAGAVFGDANGAFIPDKKYREECFAKALEQMGLPLVIDGKKRKITPHCCRHTFATLMKNVQAPDQDKLQLIGHTSQEMLRHYQHTRYDDLRKITDNL